MQDLQLGNGYTQIAFNQMDAENGEKKEFLRDFIKSVEIYPEKVDNGCMLKQINFNFPVYYDGEVGKEI